MQPANGRSACAACVSIGRAANPRLPTLLMSAVPKQSLVLEGLIRNATDLLQKPFSTAELFAKLERLLPQPSSATTHA